MAVSELKTIHVAVAVVKNDSGQVLLALRPDHVHQGGLWEFPGGKLEPGETLKQALSRELFEEIGIELINAEPLIRVKHNYTDRCVLLDVWSVFEYKNKPYGREGQKVEWASIDELSVGNMPAANLPIINAIRLPECCLITPDLHENCDIFMQSLKQALTSGIKLVQFRTTNLSEPEYIELAKKVVSLSHDFGAKALINQSSHVFEQCQADGLHLNSKRLMEMRKRPVDKAVLLSASCHNAVEIERANEIGVDFILLSPVLPTQSHPGGETLGWESFKRMTELADMPVYALGGMEFDHLAQAKYCGAQGIAAIRALWGDSNHE